MTTTLRLAGTVPPEAWNRIGIKILTKMKSGVEVQARVDLSVNVDRKRAAEMFRELRLAVNDLGLNDRLPDAKGRQVIRPARRQGGVGTGGDGSRERRRRPAKRLTLLTGAGTPGDTGL